MHINAFVYIGLFLFLFILYFPVLFRLYLYDFIKKNSSKCIPILIKIFLKLNAVFVKALILNISF